MPLIVALILCTLIVTEVVAVPSRAFLRLDKNNDGKLAGAELSTSPAGLIKAIVQVATGRQRAIRCR
jgi:hypothetical protein